MSERRSELDFKDKLIDVLDKYRDLGEIVHPNGTMSIGKIPGKEKWFLVHIYDGLAPEEIVTLEHEIGQSFPDSLRAFFLQCNGLRLFSAGQFSIWGKRGPAPAGMPNYQPIPFSISHLDSRAEVTGAPADAIYFGEYFGEYNFFVTSKSDVVTACNRSDATAIEQWDDVESMVLDVAKRLSVWFDENAQPVSPVVNQRPVLFQEA